MLLFVSVFAFAQDKVFLRNGKVIPCKIIAISEKTISYKDTVQNSLLITVSKNDVLLTEYQAEKIYMFSKEQSANTEFKTLSTSTMPEITETRQQRAERRMKEWKEKEALLPNNILGFYIPELLLGRLTVSYERLLANKSMGVKIPFSLTYDGLGALAEFSSNNSTNTNTNSTNTNTNSPNNNTNNSNNPPVKRNRGTGFITGIDVNYYHDLKPQLKYFFGPRVRYGTDMMLGGIEGLTFQIQNGIFKSSGKKLTSTIAFGVGFFKLSERYAGRGAFDPKQVYPWASFTWRLGFRL
ncbi:MAG: hypothetical protein V4677_03970 [Bacteroidota bacterium]